MANDKLLLELQEQIITEAEAYKRKPHYRGGEPLSVSPQHYLKTGYQAGATAWAPWKVRFDELQATIDDKIDKALHAERNKMQAMVTKMDMDWLQRAQGLADTLEWIRVYGNVGELTIKFIDKALQQFKDGKEAGVSDPCTNCGKELFRDRHGCCRECGAYEFNTNPK